MLKFKLLLLFVLIILLITIRFFYLPDSSQISLTQKVENVLRKRMNADFNIYLFNKENIFSSELLLEFYKTFDCRPIWVKDNGSHPFVDSLITKIKESVFDGLNPSDYHITALEILHDELLKCKNQSEDSAIVNKWADFEILLSDAFLTYTTHLYAGRLQTEKLKKELGNTIISMNLITSLKSVVKKNSITETINSFSCIHPQYKQLKALLKKHITISKGGGWPLLPNGTRLKIKDKNEKVKLLRKRLAISGEYTETEIKSDSLFDSTLAEAVKEFQRKHGLKDNGTIDLSTLNELNISIESRIKQIILTMERWRWFPRAIKQPYILVNIPSFRLEVIDSNENVMDMKIIVGMPTHPTPTFNADITYLILNPWWEIPMSIARKEMLPNMKQDTSYFTRNNINIYTDWGQNGKPVPVNSIGWDSLNPYDFHYRLRQTPGPWNALGQIKFMFPNKYDIYLHDTPTKELFSKTSRAFSHGCIRIEQPMDLAAYLLRNDSSWTKEELVTALNSKKQQIIFLSNPIKVYICYFTVWIDKLGSPYFGKDIYKYNKALERALFHYN